MTDLYDDAVARIYADCHHTKYEGCRPCAHDRMVQELSLRELTTQAQELGLYDIEG